MCLKLIFDWSISCGKHWLITNIIFKTNKRRITFELRPQTLIKILSMNPKFLFLQARILKDAIQISRFLGFIKFYVDWGKSFIIIDIGLFSHLSKESIVCDVQASISGFQKSRMYEASIKWWKVFLMMWSTRWCH